MDGGANPELGPVAADREYTSRADRHRPAVDGVKREALCLLTAGLSERDVSVALRVAEPVIGAWAAASERP
jgi:hypothetical protein